MWAPGSREPGSSLLIPQDVASCLMVTQIAEVCGHACSAFAMPADGHPKDLLDAVSWVKNVTQTFDFTLGGKQDLPLSGPHCTPIPRDSQTFPGCS